MIERILDLALSGVYREFPYYPGWIIRDDDDVTLPRVKSPIFCGCFDWHSAVHMHWTLARGLRLAPEYPRAESIRARFDDFFNPEGGAAEQALIADNPGFERPYGLAWLLALADELEDHHPRPWFDAISGATNLAAERLEGWLLQLGAPVRSGQHGQSAFAMALITPWARRKRPSLSELIDERARRFYLGDRDVALEAEPSAHDFLSPILATAELMSMLLDEDELSEWLDAFAPSLGRSFSYSPVLTVDRSDGKLAHFDGLNLSRAWMLCRIADALPEGDPRCSVLRRDAEEHGRRGLDALSSDEYAVTHWVPTFALRYLLIT